VQVGGHAPQKAVQSFRVNHGGAPWRSQPAPLDARLFV
jgi:hypothetical protein